MTNQIWFKGRIVQLDHDPKTGVCNRCRYVVGEVHSVTSKVYNVNHMHHESYDPLNVLADTMELCPVCHGEVHRLIEDNVERRDEDLERVLEIWKPQLFRVLRELHNAGDTGLHTRELLREVKSTNYGQRMIKLGESKGYIKRERDSNPEVGKRGGEVVKNRLTPKGKAVVKKLIEIANLNNNTNNNNSSNRND